MSTRIDWRSRLARAAAAAACLALAWAILVALTGGVRGHIGPVLVSSRDWERSGVAAAVFYSVALLLARPGHRSLPWVWLVDCVERGSPVVAIVAAAAVLWFGLQYGARVAGGADSLGYVSQAYLWLHGDLQIEQPLAAEAPWLFADDSMTPLGYTPGAVRHTSVPTYPPGLPMIMAGSLIVCGACGPFYVAPLFGALMVVLTWGLAHRLTESGLTSALAAVMMASSPAFLFNLVVPMSDVVTAALWIAAFVLLTWPRPWHAAAAGFLAGAAILVRPNLVLLSVAGVLAVELWTTGTRHPVRRGRRALAFLLGVVPAAAAVGIINDLLYGSPLRSGYPRFAHLFAVEHFPANLRLYATWLVESQSAAVFLALVPVLFRPARPAWLTFNKAVPLVAFTAILCVSYFFYLEFDAWWFLRFFLPAFPFLFMLVAAALVWLGRLLPASLGIPALVATSIFVVGYSLGFVASRRLPEIGGGEQRYGAVAEYVDRQLPPNAAIIAMQHSGTLAFYTGRITIRYDRLPGQRLRSVIDWLSAKGYRPYLVLEEWEEEKYRRYFSSGQDALSRLDVPVLAETTPGIPVRIYDPLGPPGATIPPIPIPVVPTRACAEPRGYWGR